MDTPTKPGALALLSRLAPLLLVLTGLVHLAGLEAPFVLDDVPSIVQSPDVERLWPPTAPPGTNADGRPLVALSLALNFALGGREPLGYHLFNLGVHLLETLVLFALVARCGERAGIERGTARLGALALALVWTVHPLHGAVLDQPVYRNESMMGLAFLGTLLAALHGFGAEGRARRAWFALAVACAWLGAGCKEVMATVPVAVLLLDRQLGAGTFAGALRRHRGLYLGLALTWPLLAWILHGTSRGESVGLDLAGLTPLDYLRTQAGVLLHYLRLTVWPDPLLIDYWDWPIARTTAAALPAAALVLALVALGVVLLVRRRPAGALIVGSLVVLSPTSSFIPLAGAIVGEHRVHLPLAAWLLAAGLGLGRLIPTRSRASLLLALAAVLALPLAWRTHQRHVLASDPVELWAEHVRARPGNARAWGAYGAALRSAGRAAEAEQAARRTLELTPGDHRARVNLGNLALDRGDLAGAREEFEEAVRLAPEEAAPRYGLGSTLALLGEDAGAVLHLGRALAGDLDPRLAGPARQTLAWKLATTRDPEVLDPERALGLARELAAGQAGTRPRVLATLAAAQAAAGDFAAARTNVQRALEAARARGDGRLAALYEAQAASYARGRRWTE